MKKICVLILALSLVLTGCLHKNEATYGTFTKEQSNEQAEITHKAEVDNVQGASTEDIMYDHVANLAPYFSRTPQPADWSFMKKQPSFLEEVDLWSGSLDVRLKDLSLLDLTGEKDRLMDIVFDTATIWPDKLPEGFDAESILKTGENPGLGIRSLHKQGITGKGINIAIIDQPLLLDHKEYQDRIMLYSEVNAEGAAYMHGPFVTSICAGNTTGVAPEVNIYYIACFNCDLSNTEETAIDNTYLAAAIDKVVDINKKLPMDKKIRALSMSYSWSSKLKGYQELMKAIDRAEKDGIFVISCNIFETHNYWTYSMDKLPTTDPDNSKSYFQYEWKEWVEMIDHVPGCTDYYEQYFKEHFDSEFLLVPIGSRTYASPTGNQDYTFMRDGGWSLMEPYLTGLYALACQVDPGVTPKKFWKAALTTGESRKIRKGDNQYPARFLNPVALIQYLQE